MNKFLIHKKKKKNFVKHENFHLLFFLYVITYYKLEVDAHSHHDMGYKQKKKKNLQNKIRV